jgi:hypothetical protein
MSFNQFTNLDFQNLKTQIKDYLRANSDFTDFDFEGSNFSALIDVLAYNSYITAFNTNMAVNEVFLDSATLRENVVSLARNIGYVPRSRRSAKAKISFSVDMTQSDARTLTLYAGQITLGSVRDGNYIFSVPENITVPIDNTGFAFFDELDIYEGIYLTSTFNVDYSQPNQRFILPNSNIDTTTIRVSVRDQVSEVYSSYNNILKIDSQSRIFLIQEVEDEKYELLFGDNILGKRPPNGSTITVTYIVTNGTLGNGALNFTFSGILKDNNLSPVTTGISLVRTIQQSVNGDNVESLDSIKYLAPRVYASQYRAVTANDYKGLIPFIYSNVDSVTAYGGEELDPPEFGKVFISIKPRNGNFLSEITKQDIKRSLKQYSIAGIQPEIIDLSYLYIEVDTTVYYDVNKGSDAQNIRTKVLNTLTEYSKSSDVNSFGGRFKYSKVSALIDDTDQAITSNITKIKMRRDLIPEFGKLATYELCFGNKIYIKKGGYSIKSSGFKIDGVNDTIYMADTQITDTSGRIFFFKIENNVPSIVKINAGTVNYITGDILLEVVNIVESSLNTGVIEVQAIPESNDVIGLKDLYLQVDIQGSNISMIQDIITSGENTSATQFVVTSSYLNGKYTR